MKPRIFISSTIRDFFDLRNALRWWLEDLGFDAQASEYTDFDKPIEASAIEACLENVKSCDHYVLLIGNQRGSLYDGNEDISITKLEFRTAYDSYIKTGKPSISTFLRDSADLIIRQPDPKPSIDCEHPLFIKDFVREIENNSKQNFVRRFKAFSEIVVALKNDLNAKAIVKRKLLEVNLKQECVENIKLFFQDYGKGEKFLQPLYFNFPDDLFRENPITLESAKTLDGLKISGDQCFLIWQFIMLIMNPVHLHTYALGDSISSGEFLEYESQTATFRIGAVQDALLTLRGSVMTYKSSYSMYHPELYKRLTSYIQQNNIRLSIDDQVQISTIYDSHYLVFNQIKELLNYLYNGVLPKSITELPIPMLEQSSTKSTMVKEGFIKDFVSKNYVK